MHQADAFNIKMEKKYPNGLQAAFINQLHKKINTYYLIVNHGITHLCRMTHGLTISSVKALKCVFVLCAFAHENVLSPTQDVIFDLLVT